MEPVGDGLPTLNTLEQGSKRPLRRAAADHLVECAGPDTTAVIAAAQELDDFTGPDDGADAERAFDAEDDESSRDSQARDGAARRRVELRAVEGEVPGDELLTIRRPLDRLTRAGQGPARRARSWQW